MTEADADVAARGLSSPKRRPSALGRRKSQANGPLLRPRETSGLPAQLSILQSHPAWASVLATCLHRQAQTVVEALGLVGLPIAALGCDGTILAANKPLTALMPSLLRKVAGRLRLNDPVADQLITNTLVELNRTGDTTAARAIPVRTVNDKPAAAIYIVPIGKARNELAAICGLMIVVPMQSRPAPSSLVLQRLFGLSPAEARVAGGIAAGQTVQAIAGDFDVSRETIRSQLKTALAKTGVKRQLDLAVLMASLQLLKA